MHSERVHFDEIGYWSELKLEIVRKYAKAYSTILSRQPGLTHYYIDGFAGPGVHLSKRTGDFVPGSPLNALLIEPSFRHHFLIDLDGGRIAALRRMLGTHEEVSLYEGDCNRILVEEVLPRVRYEDYRRALCLLDPYGLQLDWKVIETAGRLGTIDLFLNFPIMDMNRNALWRDPERVTEHAVERMTRFWGDDSWRGAAYHSSAQEELFGSAATEKSPNSAIVQAFRRRLRDHAGFLNVPEPLAMRNSTNAVVYYLFFASRNATASDIIEDIFARYREGKPTH
ncbi:MAG: three-Cys-motif partner protein TcmP [Candidatus Eisenbacteria bacterium]|nr:three-Cys-motif partner protein TcmP [Candidatus Eisenbacteria bacterium]